MYATPTSEKAKQDENPLLASYLQRQQEKRREEMRKRALPQPDDGEGNDANESSQLGDLAPNSIFNDPVADAHTTVSIKGAALGQAIPPGRLLKLDPMPHRRRRWERNMTIKSIQRRGRLTKDEIIKRTERSFLSRSELFRTSMKKLTPIANQIAGKTLEDAIVQMRFSKKKAAIAVREHLEAARDRAIVRRGMGLGKAQGTAGPRAIVKTKDGSRLDVKDRTAIYVDQAWVNKGRYGQDINPRARGRIDRLRLPQTSISVLLKEEATRVREHHDRVAREKNKKVWTALPDRPVTEQRQYYCW